MNNALATPSKLPSMSVSELNSIYAIQNQMSEMPQEDISTHHVIHAGIYTRTIKIRQGMAIVGVLVKIPTTLVVNGDVTFNSGSKPVRLTGHHVIPASAYRKQAFIAHEDTYLSMSFATDAKSIEEAEEQFTDEFETLISRHPLSINEIDITGE